MDIEHLIEGIRSGDQAAGAFLISVYGQQLLGYCHAVGSDLSETDREMICERSVERAIRKIDLFDTSRGTFFGWLRGILRREVINWRRTTARMEEWDEWQEEGDKDDRVDDSKARDVGNLLSQLTSEDQLILWSHYGEQMPYRELALRLDTTEANCRQRCLRARNKAKELASRDPKWAWVFEGGPDDKS